MKTDTKYLVGLLDTARESMAYDMRSTIESLDREIKRYRKNLEGCQENEKDYYEEKIWVCCKQRQLMRVLVWEVHDRIDEIISAEIEELIKSE